MPKPDPENLKLFEEGKKRCCKCKEIQDLNKFTKCKTRFNGYNPRCIDCDIKYRIENKEKYYATQLEKRKKMRTYHCDREKKRRAKLGPDECRRRSRINYVKNKEHIRRRIKERFETEPAYKMAKCLRDRLYHAIRKVKTQKYSHTKELLGCDFDEFKKYIETLWKPGMTWDNHGHGRDKWTIDHIIPCAAFDLSKKEDQEKCFHYTNLQPLWYSENAEKNSRYNGVRRYYDKREESGEEYSSPDSQMNSSDITLLQDSSLPVDPCS